ncbi:olfactory receptor 1-like [Hyperolius riggenbachi]|uniref:olfactory receptor 1-like n=1 Tax=Hyperolius riggenbachi TaxID=752182 RepID=UPI0035A2CCC6
MLLSGISSVTFTQCFTQMYFFYFLASVENLLLVLMAYDRGVAICSPLHYINILNKKKCFMLIIVIFVTASLNSLLITLPNKKLHFCNSNTLQHFFCESKAMTKIATSGAEFIYRVFYIELFSFGLVPCLCSFVSYVKILKVIFDIKSSEGRRKAFSTCSSHLTVISLYFGTAALMILMPPSKYSDLLDQVFTMLFSVIIPMLNPLIYSLRNKDVHGAVLRLVGGKVKPIIVFTRPKAAKAYDKLSKQF